MFKPGDSVIVDFHFRILEVTDNCVLVAIPGYSMGMWFNKSLVNKVEKPHLKSKVETVYD
jgi:hypothetical protein